MTLGFSGHLLLQTSNDMWSNFFCICSCAFAVVIVVFVFFLLHRKSEVGLYHPQRTADFIFESENAFWQSSVSALIWIDTSCCGGLRAKKKKEDIVCKREVEKWLGPPLEIDANSAFCFGTQTYGKGEVMPQNEETSWIPVSAEKHQRVALEGLYFSHTFYTTLLATLCIDKAAKHGSSYMFSSDSPFTFCRSS